MHKGKKCRKKPHNNKKFEKKRKRQNSNRRRQSGVKESMFLHQEYWKMFIERSKLPRII